MGGEGATVVGKTIELDLPQAEMEKGMLYTFYKSYLVLVNTISTVESQKDIRIPLLTDALISLITDEDIRDKVRERKENEIKNRIEAKEAANPNLSNEDKGEIKFQVCMEMIGEVVSFFDQFEGITHKLAVGLI